MVSLLHLDDQIDGDVGPKSCIVGGVVADLRALPSRCTDEASIHYDFHIRRCSAARC